MDNNRDPNLPYFDHLLALLGQQNAAVTQSFGRHVHWGYWQRPERALLTDADFAQAAENLSGQVCQAGRVGDGQAVLDVGCGFGGTIAHLNERHHGMALTGLNIDRRQLRRASEQVRALPGNRVDFVNGDACRLPFADRSFDAVLAVECVFHFADRRQFFVEALRVLKPGGRLALSDFVPAQALRPAAARRWPAWRFYGRCQFDHGDGDYRRLAEECGLAPVWRRDITRNTLPTYSYLRRLGLRQRLGGASAALETLVAEALSRSRLLAYMVYGWQKR